MFTQKESTFIHTNYFNLVRTTEDFIEFQSKCTKHCWIIRKNPFSTGNSRTIIIYHKHSPKIEYYHKHWECFTVRQAIDSIKKHDDYVLKYAYH